MPGSTSKKRLTSNGTNGSAKSKKSTKSKGKNDTGCMRKLSAILTRCLFALHAGIALWRVSFDHPTYYLYFLSIGLAFLLFEMVFTLAVRQGREYKWFCPSVLFYLMSVVPCLWFLELSRLQLSMQQAIQLGICNDTLIPANISFVGIQAIEPDQNLTISNRTRREVEEANLYLFESNVLLNRHNLHRTRRDTREGSSEGALKPEKNRGKRKRKLKVRRRKQKQNVTEITTYAITSNGWALTNESTPYTTTPVERTAYNLMDQTTRTRWNMIPLDITTTTARTNTVESDDNEIEKFGKKIQKGFSDLEKNTIDLFNNTQKEVTRFVKSLSKSVDEGTWILLLHQVLLFVLVIGRWLLPKGDITRDQLSQLLLVFIGVGADILEFVTETLDSDGIDKTSCGMVLHYVIYGVWSWSLLQFTLVLTASKSRKTRVGFETQKVRTTNGNGCCAGSLFSSADLWGILVTLFLQDVPFLATRLYILIVYDLKHQMMIFFTGKNALVVILQIYRIIVLKLQRKNKKEDVVDEQEMQPLRGTLVQLARKATMVADAGDANTPEEIRNATFKAQRDGSVVVKIHLEGEETLKKKRNGTRQ